MYDDIEENQKVADHNLIQIHFVLYNLATDPNDFKHFMDLADSNERLTGHMDYDECVAMISDQKDQDEDDYISGVAL